MAVGARIDETGCLGGVCVSEGEVGECGGGAAAQVGGVRAEEIEDCVV